MNKYANDWTSMQMNEWMESGLERTEFTIPYPVEPSSISFEVYLAFSFPAQQVLLPLFAGGLFSSAATSNDVLDNFATFIHEGIPRRIAMISNTSQRKLIKYKLNLRCFILGRISN